MYFHSVSRFLLKDSLVNVLCQKTKLVITVLNISECGFLGNFYSMIFRFINGIYQNQLRITHFNEHTLLTFNVLNAIRIN
jgi:hypothetical protein